jgi:hypothetical protein
VKNSLLEEEKRERVEEEKSGGLSAALLPPPSPPLPTSTHLQSGGRDGTKEKGRRRRIRDSHLLSLSFFGGWG